MTRLEKMAKLSINPVKHSRAWQASAAVTERSSAMALAKPHIAGGSVSILGVARSRSRSETMSVAFKYWSQLVARLFVASERVRCSMDRWNLSRHDCSVLLRRHLTAVPQSRLSAAARNCLCVRYEECAMSCTF